MIDCPRVVVFLYISMYYRAFAVLYSTPPHVFMLLYLDYFKVTLALKSKTVPHRPEAAKPGARLRAEGGM